MMPPAGAAARAERAATLALAIHARESDPGLGALLDALDPWAAGEDPDSDDVRLIYWTRRDFEKSVRVPAELAAELSKARALGQAAWQEARAANDYGRFRDALERNVELRRRYVACFDGYEHPYDAMLDDFEPGLTTAELRPLFAQLRDALVPLVTAAGDPDQPRNNGALHGTLRRRGPARSPCSPCSRGSASTPTRGASIPRCTRSPPGSRRTTSASPPSTTRATSRSPSTARCTSSATASTRRASTAVCSAPRSTTPSRSASTSRRAACGRTSSAARARSAPGCTRGSPSGFPARSTASTPPGCTGPSTPSSRRSSAPRRTRPPTTCTSSCASSSSSR